MLITRVLITDLAKIIERSFDSKCGLELQNIGGVPTLRHCLKSIRLTTLTNDCKENGSENHRFKILGPPITVPSIGIRTFCGHATTYQLTSHGQHTRSNISPNFQLREQVSNVHVLASPQWWWTIVPTMIWYCLNIIWAHRSQCEDDKVDLRCVKPFSHRQDIHWSSHVAVLSVWAPGALSWKYQQP